MSDQLAHRVAEWLRPRLDGREPRLVLVLGSGLGGLIDDVTDGARFSFDDIPSLPPSGVVGQAGRLATGRLAGCDVLVLAGRYHLYEGHSPALAALPARLAHALGARALFVSNAAGGVRRTFRPGDLMLIRDHINLLWRNPLVGPVQPGEERFPDMSRPYDDALSSELRAAALTAQVPLVDGVYAAITGPSYETPAEVRMLEHLGADAVGMSTVPEVLAARAVGVRVAGVSCITNLAAGLTPRPLAHEEVLERAERSQMAFAALVREWVARVRDKLM